MKQRNIGIVLNVVIALAIYYILYNLSFSGMIHVNYERHHQFSLDIFKGSSHAVVYPIFHIVVRVIEDIFSGIHWKILWGYLFFAIYVVRLHIVSYYLKSNDVKFSLFLSFLTLVIFNPLSIYVPYNGLVYPNLVHSPTTLFTFPFSLILYVYTARRLNNFHLKDIVFVTFLSLFVFFTKPSYILSFFPGFVFYLFFLNKNIASRVTLLFCSVFFALVIISANSILIKTSGTGVMLNPFKVWLLYNDNSLVRVSASVIFSTLFPVYILLRELGDNNNIGQRLQFSWLIFIISLTSSFLFSDSVQYLPAANFIQALSIPFNILYIESMIVLFRKNYNDYFGYYLFAFYASATGLNVLFRHI